MEDERLAQIEKAKLDAINQSNNTYDQMHQDNQNMLDQNTNYAEEYEKTQNENLDKQLEFYKQNIDKQKEQAQKNYETESLRAENDYIAYNNPYGYQAETFAAKGQLGSGLTRTAQIGSYNAYQNRLATANKAMNDAFTQYDLDMNEAIINNDVQKAQNALDKLKMILGFQENFYDTKNQINQNQMSNNQNLNSDYYGRYMDMVNQINSEKEREEAIRQFEAQMAYKKKQDALAMAYQKERDAVEDARWEKEYALNKKTVNYNTSGGGGVPLGDSLSDSKPEDYYFSNGYQPRYIQDSKGNYVKLEKSGQTALVNGKEQNIWKANGKLYIWRGNGNKGGYYEKLPGVTKTNIAKNNNTSKTSSSTNKTTANIVRNSTSTNAPWDKKKDLW